MPAVEFAGVPPIPSPLFPSTFAVALTAVSVFAKPPAPLRWSPGAPRNPSPSTLTVPARVSAPVVSSASTPPTDPFQASAVRPEEVVADVYWGTRTTWNERWPAAPVAAAVR